MVNGVLIRRGTINRNAKCCSEVSCPGRSAARSSCEAVRCRAGAVTSVGAWYGPGSAGRHEECRTASGTHVSPPIPQARRDAVDGELDAAQHLLVGGLAVDQFLAVLLEQLHLHVVERI